MKLKGSRKRQQWLTLWYLKYVLRDTQPRPMCLKICSTLFAEPPASRVAIHNKKFAAGIPVPGITGWLCHVLTCFGHLGLEHVVVTTASVPTCLASSDGLSVLQTWQKLNNSSNWDKNTICFGSVLRFVPVTVSLSRVKGERKNHYK